MIYRILVIQMILVDVVGCPVARVAVACVRYGSVSGSPGNQIGVPVSLRRFLANSV